MFRATGLRRLYETGVFQRVVPAAKGAPQAVPEAAVQKFNSDAAWWLRDSEKPKVMGQWPSADLNWALNAMGVTPCIEGAKRNAPLKHVIAKTVGRFSPNRAIVVSRSSAPTEYRRVYPRADLTASTPPPPVDADDARLNSMPLGFYHPTVWVSQLPRPVREKEAINAGAFGRLAARVLNKFNFALEDPGIYGTWCRDVTIKHPRSEASLNVRIVSDLARDDAILGTLFTTVSDNLSPHYAKANEPVPDAPQTFKALRDFPYHIEAFLASSFVPAKPASYGLTDNKPFVMINFDTRQVIAGAGATASDLAHGIVELALHLTTRSGDCLVQGEVATSPDGSVRSLVAGWSLATNLPSSFSLSGVSPTGQAVSSLSGGQSSSSSAEKLDLGKGALVEDASGGRSLVTAALPPSAHAKEPVSVNRIVLVVEDATGTLPLVTKVAPDQLKARYLIGRKADGSEPCFTYGVNGSHSLAQNHAQFSQFADHVAKDNGDLFIVVGNRKESGNAVRALVNAAPYTAEQKVNPAFQSHLVTSLEGVSAQSLTLGKDSSPKAALGELISSHKSLADRLI